VLQTIVSALTLVVTTLLLGVLAGWRGDQDAQAARSLNTMVLTWALSLLLFIGTATSSREALAAEPPRQRAGIAASERRNSSPNVAIGREAAICDQLRTSAIESGREAAECAAWVELSHHDWVLTLPRTRANCPAAARPGPFGSPLVFSMA
jgi:hypothetical protein